MTLMHDVLREQLDISVVVYLDDILIYSRSMEQHAHDVATVLTKLRQPKLYAKLSKCEFGKPRVEFLGHFVSHEGISMDPAKVQAIVDWKPPATLTDLRAFLGLANYYRRYILGFSKITLPLTRMLKKGAKIEMGPEELDSFNHLKGALSSAPVLAIADPNLPYRMVTDASDYATGAILLQDQGNGWQPIAYESRKLQPAVVRRSIYEKVMLAILHALKAWRCYVHGRTLEVRTDHDSLKWLLSQQTLDSTQAKWIQALRDYDSSIILQPGRINPADALSRNPTHREGKTSVGSLTMVQTDEGLLDRFRQAYASDPNFGGRDRRSRGGSPIQYQQGDLWYQDEGGVPKIVVPTDEQLRLLLFHEVHDAPIGAHLGAEKTAWRLRQTFVWPGLDRDTRQYVRGCDQCQRNKPVLRKPTGLLQPLPLPTDKWVDLSMDFITKLPKTSRGNDAVFVIVDRFTKWAYMVPIPEAIDAPQVAQLFFNHVFTRHGMPKTIVSDRDTLFLSHFWQTLWELMGTRLKMSSAYHPQTDGQTEVVNRIIIQALRGFVGAAQDNWDLILPSIEFAYNTSYHSAIKTSPFFLNYGKQPLIPPHLLKPLPTRAPAVDESISQLQEAQQLAKTHLVQSQARYRQTANPHRRSQEYKVGERVLLSNEHLAIPRGGTSRKLREVWAGPYLIVERIGEVNYRLQLPPTMRVHPVFHVSRLKPYYEPEPDRRSAPVPPIVVDGTEEYEVEALMGDRKRGRVQQYLVQWKGYPTSDNTWEKEQDLEPHARDALQEYRERQQRRRRPLNTLGVSAWVPVRRAPLNSMGTFKWVPVDRPSRGSTIPMSHNGGPSEVGPLVYKTRGMGTEGGITEPTICQNGSS